MRGSRRSAVLLMLAAATAIPSSIPFAQPAPATAPVADQPAAPAAPAAPADQPAPPAPPTVQPATKPFNTDIRVPGTRVSATTRITLKYKDAPLDTILNYLSEKAGYIIIKDPSATLDGRVTVTALDPIEPKEAIKLLNTALKDSGLTIIQQEGSRILKVTRRDLARVSTPVRTGTDPKVIEPSEDLVTWIIPLKTIDAVKLKQDLQTMVSSEATLTSNGGSNSIVITDSQTNVRRIVEIVAALDSNQTLARDVKVVQLKYADATQAAKLITDIFRPDDAAAGGGGGATDPRVAFFRSLRGGGGGPPGSGGRGGPGGGGAAADDKAKQGKITASSDQRTNTVVMAGEPEVLKSAEEVLHQIDNNPAAESTFFIYPLKNGQAAKLQVVLNNLFGGGTGTGGRSTGSTGGFGNRGGFGGTGNTGFGNTRGGGSSFGSGGFGGGGGGFGGGGGGRSGSSAFGGSSGRTGTGSQRGGTTGSGRTAFGSGGTTGGFGGLSSGASQAASDLIGQVFVVADEDTNSLLVATATKFQNDVRNIIGELDRPVPQVLIKVLIAEVSHNNSTDLGVDFSILNTRGTSPNLKGTTGGTNFGLARATGGLVVSVVESNVTATLRALAQTGKLDVLSRPYILASDNQQASITVGQEVPFVTNSRTDTLGNLVNTIQYQDIGIILNVIPHINPEGLVILDVTPEISSLTDSTVEIGSNLSAPIYNKRSADTRVGVQDGQTIVIGGLMDDRKTATLQKVPLLGDIPLLGAVFQRNQVSKTKTELLIFLTPHVAAQPTQLNPMSQDEMRGLKLTPGAVEPGVFDEHMRGLQRGGAPAPSVTPRQPENDAQPPREEQPTDVGQKFNPEGKTNVGRPQRGGDR